MGSGWDLRPWPVGGSALTIVDGRPLVGVRTCRDPAGQHGRAGSNGSEEQG
jgi:hypothetical protein